MITRLDEAKQDLKRLERELECCEDRMAINDYGNLAPYTAKQQRKDLKAMIEPLRRYIESGGNPYKDYPAEYWKAKELVNILQEREFPAFTIAKMIEDRGGYSAIYLGQVVRRLGNMHWRVVNLDLVWIIINGLKDKVDEIELNDIVRKKESMSPRLKPEQVKQIRALLDKGMQQKLIAKKFGVSNSCISNINTGRFWKDKNDPIEFSDY